MRYRRSTFYDRHGQLYKGYKVFEGREHLGWVARVPQDDEDARPGWWRSWPVDSTGCPRFTTELVAKRRQDAGNLLARARDRRR